MSYRSLPLALCGLAAFGLAACDSADGPAAMPETATGAFDAALFAGAEQLITVSNQANANANDRAVRFRNPDALARKAAFFRQNRYPVTSFQSALFEEGSSTFFGTFDVGTAESPQGRLAMFDRRGNQIAFDDGTLVSPKGLSAFSGDEGVGIVFVADVGQSGGFGYFFDDGMLAPTGVINEPGAPNWDFHFDSNGIGFVFGAGTDGFVSVYGDFGDPIDRFQVLDANGNPATNNHGITYDAESGTLIVSDVGLAGSDDDGAINVIDYNPFEDGRIEPNLEGGPEEPFVLPGPNANQPIQARATYAGANTMLGNPVDIAGSGSDLFVAEKAANGGMMMRFAGVLSATGVQDVAPAATSPLEGAESVDVYDRDAIGGGGAPTDIVVRTGEEALRRWGR